MSRNDEYTMITGMREMVTYEKEGRKGGGEKSLLVLKGHLKSSDEQSKHKTGTGISLFAFGVFRTKERVVPSHTLFAFYGSNCD